MAVFGQQPVPGKSRNAVLVSAPALKFAIGSIASLCAVLVPRLIAALSIPDRANITFVSGAYFGLALLFSGLVGLVVTVLEWRVPRAPGDTFMTTLGIPAILAGGFSASQNTAELQKATHSQNELADVLIQRSGIAIEPAPAAEPPGNQGRLTDFIVSPVYAQGTQPIARTQQPSRLAIMINQPRYFIVLDRAQSEQDAQTRASQMIQRLKAVMPARPLNVEIQRQRNEFLVVVAGGPRFKSDAVLEAVQTKDLYRVSPTLIEALK